MSETKTSMTKALNADVALDMSALMDITCVISTSLCIFHAVDASYAYVDDHPSFKRSMKTTLTTFGISMAALLVKGMLKHK